MVVSPLSFRGILVRYIGILTHYMSWKRSRLYRYLVGWVNTIELGLKGPEQIVKTSMQELQLAEAPGIG